MLNSKHFGSHFSFPKNSPVFYKIYTADFSCEIFSEDLWDPPPKCCASPCISKLRVAHVYFVKARVAFVCACWAWAALNMLMPSQAWHWVTWEGGYHDKRSRSDAAAAYGSVMQREGAREVWYLTEKTHFIFLQIKNLHDAFRSARKKKKKNRRLIFTAAYLPAICLSALIFEFIFSSASSSFYASLCSSWKRKTAGSDPPAGVCHFSSHGLP